MIVNRRFFNYLKMKTKKVTFDSPTTSRGKKIKMAENGSPEIVENSESESEHEEEETYPETQAILLEEEERAQAMAFQYEEEEVVDEDEENMKVSYPHNSLIAQLELYWMPTFLTKIQTILQVCVQKSVKMRDLESKRLFARAADLWINLFSLMIKGQENKKFLKRCSWTDFESVLSDQKSYMTFCGLTQTKMQLSLFSEAVDKCMQGPSSSSQNTKTTTTSCTTAPTIAAPVDVKSPVQSEGEEDALEEVFGIGNTRSITGAIPQSISTRRDEKLFTLKSPGERGYTLVKLETYQFNDISGTEKRQWWKKATLRSQFLCSSIADPKYIQVKKLINMAVKEIAAIKNVEKTERTVGSYNTWNQ